MLHFDEIKIIASSNIYLLKYFADELKMKLDYNPATFDLLAEGCRFFVIKSYSEDDIHRSIKYEIWCSTEHGKKILFELFC